MLPKELSTVRDWVRYAVSRFEAGEIFFGHGTDNAYDEAVWLVMRALHLPMDTLSHFYDAHLTEAEQTRLAALIERRVTDRTPAAYLLQEAWLRGYSFYVDERVIVPRSFIAELLETSLQPWVEYPEMVENVADLCTGSGCLGILLAEAFPNANVDVVDISPDAIAVCEINIARYDMQSRVRAIESDMFGNLAGKQYDLIISNPPYVNAEAMSQLPPEYRKEPQLALGSGDAGLDHTHTLLREAAKHLNEDGLLVVEIGHNRDALLAAYPDLRFIWLEVDAGDQFVFLLTKEDLLHQFKA